MFHQLYLALVALALCLSAMVTIAFLGGSAALTASAAALS